jgi:hypothetical protein
MLEDDDFEMTENQAKIILVSYGVLGVFFVAYFSLS